MLSNDVQDAINNQIRDEFYASHLYLSMAAYFDSENLPGCAGWMRKQSDEERAHALKLYDYINYRGGRVILQEISMPVSMFDSPLDVFEKAYKHECKVTASIHAIYSRAVQENDFATQVMLHWFIEEQVEEEKNTSDVIELLKKIGDSGHALVMLDRQLAAR